MSFIERELNRLNEALHEPRFANRRDQLYAARQALSWAQEPQGFKSPFDDIMDIPGETKDCPPDQSQD